MVDQYLYLETETIQNKYWPVVMQVLLWTLTQLKMHGTFFSKKFQLVTPPKFTRASDCLADGMATDPSSRHCELMGSMGSKGGIASQSSY